jgi:uncharacterized protein (DUF1015 family)
MLRISPFEALRPPPNQAASVSSPPYDVVSRDEARDVIDRHETSFMRVLRPDAMLDAAIDPHADIVYDAARAALDALQDAGALVREDAPRLYLYRQAWRGKRQVGLVCCCHVEDYNNDVIKKHEQTRKDKEDDRTRHVLTTACNAGPVFLTYPDNEAIDKLVDDDIAERPIFHFNDASGVTHTGWIASAHEPYVEAFANIAKAYVADGHHRSASAARAATALRKANGPHSGEQAYDWFLTVLFPASQLSILPYNRIVKDLNGLSPSDFLQSLSSIGSVERCDAPVDPDQAGTFGVYVDGQWHTLTLHASLIDASDPVQSLDCALLETNVLKPILGIGDIRTDERIGFVGGIRGLGELQSHVDSGDAAVAFSLHPVDIQQLLTVADAGQCMPPKSTWFEPKLRSGLFIHQLDAELPAHHNTGSATT